MHLQANVSISVSRGMQFCIVKIGLILEKVWFSTLYFYSALFRTASIGAHTLSRTHLLRCVSRSFRDSSFAENEIRILSKYLHDVLYSELSGGTATDIRLE